MNREVDLSGPDGATGAAILLHPHPHYGGDRFHPLIDALHRRLPEVGLGAARFDFTSADRDAAADQARDALDVVGDRWPGAPAVLVGYSFGAAVATLVDDSRVCGWCLVAPPPQLLDRAEVGNDPRPKRLVVPAHDQFGPPDAVGELTAEWSATTMDVLEGADHYLAGAIGRAVDHATSWVAATVFGGT